jgi:Replication-relaxation
MQTHDDGSHLVVRIAIDIQFARWFGYIDGMDEITNLKPKRRPRFQRASEPPAFRLTDDDVVIIRQIARHRFLKSTHIAALVGRSLDRTNDRLSRLFHAGYIDRPRAQAEYHPTSGSAPMVYAIADRGARLLAERDGRQSANVDWSRKNRQVGRPFVDHQLEVIDFYVSLQRAARNRAGVRLIHPEELVASFPDRGRSARNPLWLRVHISHEGAAHEIGLIPDLAFGLRFADGSRRCFMVEIDRGTMPIVRAKLTETSFERKMRAYLGAHAAGQHETQFGWKTFRVLTVTTDGNRMNSMIDALRTLHVPNSPGASLFFFATRDQLRATDPLAHTWRDGNTRQLRLI